MSNGRLRTSRRAPIVDDMSADAAPTPTRPEAAAASSRVDHPSTALLLSFVGGYVDTCGFIALFGLFTAHVTGNFVLIGAAIAGQGGANVVAKLLALPVFVATVMLARFLQLGREQRGQETAVPMLLAQFAFLVAFMLAGARLGPFERGDAPMVLVVGMIGVVTMAIQNTAARSSFVRLSPSTVMTGNVTQVAMDLVDIAANAPAGAPARARVHKMWPPVAAFATGALGGGLGYGAVGFWALGLPCAALAILLWRLRA